MAVIAARLAAAQIALWLAAAGPAAAGDWPMWRCDAARSAACGEKLADELHIQWSRRVPPQQFAWKDEPSMRFDDSYLPVASGGRLFVASTVNDTLTAYNLASGKELWRFYAEGPLRVAPAAWRDRIFAASDDGSLYCLAAADGKLLWRFRGGPADRRIIGNERLISTWPIRGGPAIAEDPATGKSAIYFTAGVWPFMGTFIHALDVETGRVIWTNDSTSFTFRRLPHPGSAAFDGLSPQGHLAVAGERLIVPGSAFTPAVLDRRTGKFLFYGEGAGPSAVVAGRLAVAGGQAFDLASGHAVRLKDIRRFGQSAFGPAAWYTPEGIFDPASLHLTELTIQVPETTRKDGPTYPKQVFDGEIRRLDDPRQRTRLGAPWLLAGGRLVTSGPLGGPKLPKGHSSIQVLDVADPARPRTVWQASVDGEPSDMLAADGRLVVVTAEGGMFCFGPEHPEAVAHDPAAPQPLPDPPAGPAEDVLKAAAGAEGYALVWGLADGRLVEHLLARTKLHVVAVDANAARIHALRRRLDAAGLYGSRAAAIAAEPRAVTFAPYLASVIASEDPIRAGLGQGAAFARRLFATLRPYGGAAILPLTAQQHERFAKAAADANLPGGELRREGDLTILRRPGALPGSAGWYGQNADAAGTRCSRDRLVQAPLGVLWFGNPLSNSYILPRHGEGPVQQVAGGRILIEGPDSLSAMDVYTGRVMWKRDLPGLGAYYGAAKHSRGAHAIGGNFQAVPDAIYVAAGPTCHILDPATGHTVKELKLPEESAWQFVLVYEDLLIAGMHPIVHNPLAPRRYDSPTSSRVIVVLDRHGGQVLWRRTARHSFGHYGIVAGGHKLFAVDRVAPEQLALLERRGEAAGDPARILALDARTGREVWQTDQCVADRLTYSEPRDILISGGGLRGRDGTALWHNPPGQAGRIDPASGPAVAIGAIATPDHLWWGKWGLILRGDTIFTQQFRAYDLLTGRQRTWRDVAGQEHEWRFGRSHGCGPAAGAWNILTLRSGAAGFYDLAGPDGQARDGGTGNLGGFRSGCTSNLIVADGVLTAPDYTRSCSCTYQNRSSLGLVHVPEAEYWTFGAIPTPGRAGFNFGAPGDRKADDGTLWRETPAAALPKYGGQTLVATKPADCETFCHHSSRMDPNDPHKWIGASGLIGVRAATIPLTDVDPRRPLTIRLYFAEPGRAEPGLRIFSVALDGRQVLADLDIAREAGRPWRTIVKELRDFRPAIASPGGKPAATTLTFTAKAGLPLICGVEVIQQP